MANVNYTRDASNNVIIDGVSYGFDIFAYTIGGETIICRDWTAEQIGAVKIEGELPSIHTGASLMIDMGGARDHIVLLPLDIDAKQWLKTAKAVSLSKRVARAAIHQNARILARVVDGALVGNGRKIEEFYTNLSKEEIDLVDLT